MIARAVTEILVLVLRPALWLFTRWDDRQIRGGAPSPGRQCAILSAWTKGSNLSDC